MKENELKEILTSYVSNAVIILENAEDLKETPIYTKEVKLWGNKFLQELEKKIILIEKKLYDNDEDVQLAHGIQNIYEDVFKKLAGLDVQQIINVSSFIDALKNGEVTEVSDEELKKLKNEKR